MKLVEHKSCSDKYGGGMIIEVLPNGAYKVIWLCGKVTTELKENLIFI
jgi:hypothetical protein